MGMMEEHNAYSLDDDERNFKEDPWIDKCMTILVCSFVITISLFCLWVDILFILSIISLFN